MSGLSKGLTQTFKDDFALDFDIPSVYKEALKTDSMMWVRHDNQLNEEVRAISWFGVNLLLLLTSPAPSHRLSHRKNESNGKYVSTNIEGTYLYPSNQYIPFQQYVQKQQQEKP